ncbi:MAG: DUF523 domain-containing protein [Myxococcaceae bacterium]
MKKVLVSACLLGDRVRYDGQGKWIDHPVLARWLREGRVVKVCPEVAGGLGIPRPPAERRGAHVVTNGGEDVTKAFEFGAAIALKLVQEHGVTVAVLKENSPSCGSSAINDGTFTKTRIAGAGVTTELLRRHGVKVFSELELEEANNSLSSEEERVGVRSN